MSLSPSLCFSLSPTEVTTPPAHATPPSCCSDTSGDAKARSAGVDQVLKFVDANSKGRAIIIGGDTNDRWSSSDRSIHKYKDAGFEDVWVQLVKGGVYPEAGSKPNGCPNPAPNNKCELVDKVL